LYSVELLIINDCEEDVGALNMLYDGSGRIVQELLTGVARYLKWLSEHPVLSQGQTHYIYFGGEKLAEEVFDVPGTLALLANCLTDVESDEVEQPKTVIGRCAFCHLPLEEGRYKRFDRNRMICLDCESTVVGTEEELQGVLQDLVMPYLSKKYPDVVFPGDVTVKLAPSGELEKGQEQSENYYSIDPDNRVITVEGDLPERNAAISVLRGLIWFWQKDNDLLGNYSYAQLALEEVLYLEATDEKEVAAWVRDAQDDDTKNLMGEMETAVAENRFPHSFAFLLAHADESGEEDEEDEDEEDEEDEEDGDSDGHFLYDPDKVPRFWKRYLRGETAEEGEEELPETPAEDAVCRPVRENAP
ncbi:MAG: hypothetical protein MJ078_08655, partial [Clostridia bacterium]|nr:hypothetical protein [Clostridia bacterium]